MVIGVTRVKNEADIIEAVIGRTLTQVDHIIVGDGSTDETTDILKRMPVTWLADDTPTYEQPQQMNAYAQMAREMGADWIVPFDGDEVWCADEGTLAERLMSLPDEALIAEAPLFNHVVTGIDDMAIEDPVERIQWRCTEPVPLRKVACRAREDLNIHFGQHGADYHGIRDPLRVTDVLQVRHFPYRTADQLIRKIRVGGPELVKSNLPKSFGAHWRGFYETLERVGDQGLVDWFKEWAFSADPENDDELVHDPCPLRL
jgi:hypothetical protein